MNALQTIIKKFLTKFKDKNFVKGISTLIGAGCLNFLVGAIFSLCTLSVYEISYIKGKGGSIEIEHLTFYYPVEIFFQCISAFISGIIYKKLGLHKTNLIGVIILSFGYYIMYLSTNLIMDIISMILGGIGTGIIFYPSTTNSYEWFKEHNGIIVGIMETMISFGSFFFAFIGEKIINKDEIPSSQEDNLYDFEVGKRIKIYLIFQIICLISAYILSFLLMFEKKNINNNEEIIIDIFNDPRIVKSNLENKIEDSERDDSDENLEKNLHDIKENINKIIINEKKNKVIKNIIKDIEYLKERKDEGFPIKSIINEKIINYILKNNFLNKKKTNNNISSKEKDKNIKDILKFAIKSRRLILFSIIVILQAPVSNMAFSLYREIGEYEKIDTKYLQLISSLYFIFECLSSFVFGLLCDYVKLKYLLFFINGVGTIIGFIYCFTFKNSLVFFLVQNILSFSAGGYYPVKDCFLMQVFGKDIYIELSGLVSFLVAVSVNILTPICYFVLSRFPQKEVAYWILFLSFGALNFIGLILNCFLKETPVDLEKLIKENLINKK